MISLPFHNTSEAALSDGFELDRTNVAAQHLEI